MAVLTISREIASGGWEIGKKVAERLGYHFADKDTIHEIFHQYGFLPFEKVYDKPTSFWDRFDNMRRMTLENLEQSIRALAKHGNMVIVGRGSFAILEGLSDVLQVRIQAPFDYRVRNYMDKTHTIDPVQAEEYLIEQGDLRAAFVETTYQVPWDAATSFDVVLNSAVAPENMAVDLLVQLLGMIDKAEHDPESSATGLQVDKFLMAAARGALECKEKAH